MLKIVSRFPYRRVIKLANLDMAVIAKYALSPKWREYSVVIAEKNGHRKQAIRGEINRVAHRFGWKISARDIDHGVEVICYA